MAGSGNRGMSSGSRNLPATTSQKMNRSAMAASAGTTERSHGHKRHSKTIKLDPLSSLYIEMGALAAGRPARPCWEARRMGSGSLRRAAKSAPAVVALAMG